MQIGNVCVDPRHGVKEEGCTGSLKADQVVCLSRDSAGRVNSILSCLDSLPAPPSVQDTFKVTVNYSNIVLMPFLLVTSLKLPYAPALLKHGIMSVNFIPKINTSID